MIHETIHIKNLGPLEDTGVVDIKPLTVFVGNSASGKSTLMKALVLMRYIFKRLSIRAYFHNSHIEENVVNFRFRDLLRDNMSVLVTADTYIHSLCCYYKREFVFCKLFRRQVVLQCYNTQRGLMLLQRSVGSRIKKCNCSTIKSRHIG